MSPQHGLSYQEGGLAGVNGEGRHPFMGTRVG
ncbi:jg234, partial [Pararge aegeria aegeria]